jgi:Ca2+-transporting ATPase
MTPADLRGPSTTAATEACGLVGLTSAEARERLGVVGYNRLPDPPPSGVLRRVGAQARDPMIMLLITAAGLTALLRDWPNTAIILAVVVFNTTAGIVQEFRAERAMAELQRLVAPLAHVWRDGEVVELLADGIVPDDLVELVAGDVVPADGRLVAAFDLQLDEAHVTGESLPVNRSPGDEVAGGTLVTRGHARFEVSRTGEHSAIGQIAALLASTRARATPLQRRLARLSRTLVLTVLTLTAVVVASGMVQGRAPMEMVVVGLSLAVAAVPESLPAVATVALAMGAHRMARRNAVVRNLAAVETLGSVTVVATDKTSTVTEGRMVAEVLWLPHGQYPVSGTGYAPMGEIRAPDGTSAAGDEALARLLRDAVLCNDAELRCRDGEWSVRGDPLEGALLALGAKGELDPEVTRADWPRIGEDPFDATVRRMTTYHRGESGRTLAVCKGRARGGGPAAGPGRAAHSSGCGCLRPRGCRLPRDRRGRLITGRVGAGRTGRDRRPATPRRDGCGRRAPPGGRAARAGDRRPRRDGDGHRTQGRDRRSR